MPTGPPDQSPPVEADFGQSHDAITAELLDLTWQLLAHASPSVRAELGQCLADHGQHTVAGVGAFLDCCPPGPEVVLEIRDNLPIRHNES